MAYCTAADVKNMFDNVLLAQLTAASGTTPTDATITSAAASASTWMDSYFIGRYVTPITSANVLLVLTPHACWLTIGNLFQDRLMLEQFKSIQQSILDTQQWLENVRKGATLLPGATTQTTLAATGGYFAASPFINSDGSVTLP